MSKEWYKLYGWRKNPFEIKPNPVLVGLDTYKENLLDYISGGGICLLTGLPGMGKSSMLKWMKSVYRKGTVVYIDGKLAKGKFDVSREIKKAGPWWRRMFGLFPSNVILLLDEAQLAGEDMISEVEGLWDTDSIKSIVLAQTEEDLESYPASFRDRMGQRIIRLDVLAKEDVMKLLDIRTAGNIPFTEQGVEAIAERSNCIPRKILENCEVMCVNLKGKREINDEDVNEIFSKLRDKEIQQQIIRLERKKALTITPMDRINYSNQLSPLQKSIVKVLLEDNKTTAQLASILDTSSGSVGKQLNELMKGKFVKIVNHRRPKVFGLAGEFKDNVLLGKGAVD